MRPGAGSRLSGMSRGTSTSMRHEHRHGEQEHGSPREVLEQDAADERAEGAAGREARRPDRDGEATLLAVGEDGAQQRQRRRHEHGAEEPERRAGGDEGLGRGRERGDDRDHGEAGRADQQHATSAEAVARAAHPDEEAGEHERVGVDDPELLGGRRREVARDRGQREAQHGVVDRDEQHRQHEHRERDPARVAVHAAPCRGSMRAAGCVVRSIGWVAGCVVFVISASITIPSSRYSIRSWSDAARYDRAHEPPPSRTRRRARRLRADPRARRRTRGDPRRHGARRGRVEGRPALPLRLQGGAHRRDWSDASPRSSSATCDAIETAPEGPIAYFVRSSVAMAHPLDRAVVATARLAQGGSAAAARAIRSVRERWLEAIGRARRRPDRGPRDHAHRRRAVLRLGAARRRRRDRRRRAPRGRDGRPRRVARTTRDGSAGPAAATPR